MKAARALALVVGTAVLLAALVNAPREYDPELDIRYSRDLLLIMAAVIAAARFRLASAVAFIGTVLWAAGLFYEWVRSVGVTAMSQEPLLYDAYFLVGHLYILLRDLMGGRATAMFAGVALALVCGTLVTGWLFRRIQRQLEELPVTVQFCAVIILATLGFGVESSRMAEGRNSLVDLVDNLEQSSIVREKISGIISPDAYREIRELELKKRPSVHIYIVESYGNGIRRRSLRPRYNRMIKDLQQRLRASGWRAMTGLSVAPVMGGRSWLADATLLSGRLVKYESVYRHLVPDLDRVTTVPGFFKDQGYSTVLMRPKDKARPGVSLVNHFGFDHTVFNLDLAYAGRPYGWAEIPDQYALGHLRDEVLPMVSSEPHFVFAHLGSSHIPWDEVPPLLDDWREFNEYQRRSRSKDEELSEREIKNQLKRYKRKEEVRLRRLKPSEDNVEDYLKIITYSMEAVVRHVLAMEEPPEMVIIMGDHQPPLYKVNEDFTVPMHVLVRDPKLHREFRRRGFRGGMKVPKYENRMHHEGFLSMLVRAIARPQELELPPYRSRGTSKKPSKKRGKR